MGFRQVGKRHVSDSVELESYVRYHGCWRVSFSGLMWVARSIHTIVLAILAELWREVVVTEGSFEGGHVLLTSGESDASFCTPKNNATSVEVVTAQRPS